MPRKSKDAGLWTPPLTMVPRGAKRRKLEQAAFAKARPKAAVPRKSVVTLVVTHTLATKRALREVFEDAHRRPPSIHVSKVLVRSVDFD